MPNQNQLLGTIIASMLEYDELCRFAGEEPHIDNTRSTYAPCDGRSILGSRLATTGIANAPDLRGRFLRGLNMMHNHGEFPPLDPATADPDGNDRRAGSYQQDGIIRHSHSIATNDDGTPVTGGNYKATGYSKHNGQTQRTGDNEGGQAETRPRNVAVYYYLKIN